MTMQIKFSPQRSDATVKVVKTGDSLKINNKIFNFTVIPEGGILPADAVDSEFVVDEVRREDGILKLTILLPHGPNPKQEVAFPAVLENPDDGIVPLPTDATGDA